MARRRRLERIDDPFWRELDNWPEIGVPQAHRETFNRRAELFRDYFESGLTIKKLCAKHGFDVSELYRFLDRALATDGHGGIVGWSALLPHRRLSDYDRQSDSECGFAGSFRKFLKDHPNIAKTIEKLHLARRLPDRLPGTRVPETVQLEEFHTLCADNGIQAHEYPLCLKTGGREGLRGYLRSLDKKHPGRSARLSGGDELMRNLAATRHAESRRRPVLPYTDVECDAHRMDLAMVVYIADALGEVEPYLIERAWLYVIIERVSRAVLGYRLSLNPEPCLEDFLNCVAHALAPWEPRALSIDGLEYPAGSGLPSGRITGLAWQLFDRIRLDNALVHLSPWAQQKIIDTIGATVTLGSAGEPVARAIVERFFGTLEELGWHRLGSTTGSGPKDHRRRDPGEYAKKHKITLDEVEQLLDVMIATRNASFQDGAPLHGKRSPLGYLEAFVQTDRFLPRTLRPDYRNALPFLIRPVVRTVRGSVKKRRRPYLRYENAIYRSHLLDDAWHLIGQQVQLDFNIEAAHQAPAHAIETATDLGVLMAQPPWSRPHTLRVRKAITAKRNRGQLQLGTDAIRNYERFKAKQMKDSRRAASTVTQMARSAANRGEGTESDPIRTTRFPAPIKDYQPHRRDWVSAGAARSRSTSPGREGDE